MIERLERIDALDRATASPAELLAELRGLLHDAEAWVRVEGGDAADEAVDPPARSARAGCGACLSARCGARAAAGGGAARPTASIV